MACSNGVSFLIVDDNLVHRRLLTTMLCEHDIHYAGAEAIDGAQAVRVYETTYHAAAADSIRWPQVILMDIMMPNLNGLQATEQIRKIEELAGNYTRRRAYIVAMTSLHSSEAERASHTLGFDAILTRPVTTRDLRRLLTAQPWLDPDRCRVLQTPIS